MKLTIKLGSMKPETIAKGIMICIAVIIIYRIPILIFIIPNFIIPLGTEITPFMSEAMKIQFYLVTIGTLIIELILLRLFCEVIYNIVAAAQCIVRDKSK